MVDGIPSTGLNKSLFWHLEDDQSNTDNPFASGCSATRRHGPTLADADQVAIMTPARTANRGDILEKTEMAPLVRGRRDSRARTPEDKRTEYLATRDC
jgi:hypothetical protein